MSEKNIFCLGNADTLQCLLCLLCFLCVCVFFFCFPLSSKLFSQSFIFFFSSPNWLLLTWKYTDLFPVVFCVLTLAFILKWCFFFFGYVEWICSVFLFLLFVKLLCSSSGVPMHPHTRAHTQKHTFYPLCKDYSLGKGYL